MVGMHSAQRNEVRQKKVPEVHQKRVPPSWVVEEGLETIALKAELEVPAVTGSGVD